MNATLSVEFGVCYVECGVELWDRHGIELRAGSNEIRPANRDNFEGL